MLKLLSIGSPQQIAENHDALTAVSLLAHASSKGTVRLTGSHPQDPLNIQKLRFQAPGGSADIAALREQIKRARDIINNSSITPFVKYEIFPGSDITTDEQIDDYILHRSFGTLDRYFSVSCSLTVFNTGHHACCTNAMGPDKGKSRHLLYRSSIEFLCNRFL